jgi:hypothetical protein
VGVARREEEIRKIHDVLNGHEDYVGIDFVDGRIRLFVATHEFKDELQVFSEYIDVYVARKRLSKRHGRRR